MNQQQQLAATTLTTAVLLSKALWHQGTAAEFRSLESPAAPNPGGWRPRQNSSVRASLFQIQVCFSRSYHGVGEAQAVRQRIHLPRGRGPLQTPRSSGEERSTGRAEEVPGFHPRRLAEAC